MQQTWFVRRARHTACVERCGAEKKDRMVKIKPKSRMKSRTNVAYTALVPPPCQPRAILVPPSRSTFPYPEWFPRGPCNDFDISFFVFFCAPFLPSRFPSLFWVFSFGLPPVLGPTRLRRDLSRRRACLLTIGFFWLAGGFRVQGRRKPRWTVGNNGRYVFVLGVFDAIDTDLRQPGIPRRARGPI